MVLEKMLFTAHLGPADAEAGRAFLESNLGFCGPLSGTLAVRVSEAAARTLAAGFLGEEEDALTAAQPGQVVCETANML